MAADRDVANKKVTVVGAARSGLAAARLLSGRGARVLLTDRGPIAGNVVQDLMQEHVAVESGGHTDRALDADFLVVSPGVPSDADLLTRARGQGIPVYAEIEVASWYCEAPMVAITGSNGKTTTTNLTGHVFRSGGIETFVGGNVGNAFSDYARGPQDAEVVVLEVSSFQLDEIDTFRPRVAVLLNITPDHLDRYHHRFEEYAASKFRICENQRSGDAFIYNVDDEVVRSGVRKMTHADRPDLFAISLEEEVPQGAFVRNDEVIVRCNEQEETLMTTSQLSLRGRHNLYNSLAAAVASRVMEVRSEVVRESLTTFEGVPHRLEFIRELDGVRYVNDSKATNVNAVWYALESFTEKVILIAGGRDKGNDYGPLHQLVTDRVRAVVAIGESGDKVLAELGGLVTHAVRAESMDEAVRLARLFAEPGDVVLLSPACASFDMFENYEHRGDIFRQAVIDLV